jgi:ubiquinone/menaquinone biosynthesis C-methylase UbiE
MNAPNLVGNVYDKFGSKNPVVRYLMKGFLNTVTDFAKRTHAQSVLEVGCGEGHLVTHLFEQLPQETFFSACDLSLERISAINRAKLSFQVGSAYQLPYACRSFELVVCCEVLEHLEFPERALDELFRVSSRYVLVSTPREPLWRFLNVARLSYLKKFGNTPGHIQHFSRQSLTTLLETRGRIIGSATPLPWIVLLIER